jgi:hypothetical protein
MCTKQEKSILSQCQPFRMELQCFWPLLKLIYSSTLPPRPMPYLWAPFSPFSQHIILFIKKEVGGGRGYIFLTYIYQYQKGFLRGYYYGYS